MGVHRRRHGAGAALVAATLCALLGACGSEPSTAAFSVNLRSDMLGGQDFAVVVTEISDEGGAARAKTLEANADMNFANGINVARWTGLAIGNYRLRVKLIGGDGRLIALSDRIVTLTRTFNTIVSVNRHACTNVTCGTDEQCINGGCVPSFCVTNPTAPDCQVEPPPPVDPDGGTCTVNCTDPDAGPPPPPECTEGAMSACNNGACTGSRTCSGGHWGTCSARSPSGEVLDGVDNDCNGKTDEGSWVKPYNIPWTAIGNGCANAFSSFAACQAGADAWCRATNANFVGGYGPVDFDDTNAWVVCIAKGGGAVRLTTNAAGFGKSGAAARSREGQTQAYTFCNDRGYPLTVGAVAWAGDDSVIDIICMPANYGEGRTVTQQLISDNGCGDWGTFGNTPACTRPAHRYCTFVGFTAGVGPYWVFGDAPLACLKNQ